MPVCLVWCRINTSYIETFKLISYHLHAVYLFFFLSFPFSLPSPSEATGLSKAGCGCGWHVSSGSNSQSSFNSFRVASIGLKSKRHEYKAEKNEEIRKGNQAFQPLPSPSVCVVKICLLFVGLPDTIHDSVQAIGVCVYLCCHPLAQALWGYQRFCL